MRALFLAGHRWVEDGSEPPPSSLFERSGGEIVRDERGNALGGIRHPALDLGEARFIAESGVPPIFGSYEDVQAIGEPGFFATYEQYSDAFRVTVSGLVRSGFVSQQDSEKYFALTVPGLTFTQIYQQANRRRWALAG